MAVKDAARLLLLLVFVNNSFASCIELLNVLVEHG
jgi:hypothetical protein